MGIFVREEGGGTVNRQQKSGDKKNPVFLIKRFGAKVFLIESKYSFCSVLNVLSPEILFNFFVYRATEISVQVKKILSPG